MENQEKTLVDFKNELKALLKKYNASIEVMADEGSDWYGITGEYMEVSFGNSSRHFLANGLGLWEGDL